MSRKRTIDQNSGMFRLEAADELKFSEAKKKLAALPAAESSILQMELIFFDTISALKKYDHPHTAGLMEQLHQVQIQEYARIRLPRLTPKMRNTAIRTFKNAIRNILTRAINKPARRKKEDAALV